MNAGYKGIFLLIDNKSTATETVPEEGKTRSFALLTNIIINETKITNANCFNQDCFSITGSS